MTPTPRIEALESRGCLSASLHEMTPPPPDPPAADTFAIEPPTAEAKEQFTRRKPQVPVST